MAFADESALATRAELRSNSNAPEGRGSRSQEPDSSAKGRVGRCLGDGAEAEPVPAVDYRPLCRAIAGGSLPALRAAIGDAPAAARHWKPIVDAAFAGRADLVEALLGAGADPNVVSGTGSRHTPLTRLTQHHATIAKHDGHLTALDALLAGGADANLAAGPHRFEPIAYAAMGAAQGMVDRLRATRIGTHLAAVLLDRRRLRRALGSSQRANEVDPRGRTPLHYVAASGLWRSRGEESAIACAAALLDAGAHIDGAETIDEGDGAVFAATALWRALSWQRNYALAEYLLERGASPAPAVFAATYQGVDAGCDLLDRYGADWEQRFKGRTPLMDLMYFKRPAGSRWLLARGVDVNAADEDGRTALHFAAQRGVGADTVQRLLDAGADPRCQDAAGRTPRDYAVAQKRAKLTALLAQTVPERAALPRGQASRLRRT